MSDTFVGADLVEELKTYRDSGLHVDITTKDGNLYEMVVLLEVFDTALYVEWFSEVKERTIEMEISMRQIESVCVS